MFKRPLILFFVLIPILASLSSPFGPSQSTLFGPSSTTQSSNSNIFGGPRFGNSTSFPQATATNMPVGTTIKFQPLLASDTMLKNGTNTTISTRHQCITAMKEYEGKSMEELRWEDYQVNRKASATGVFNSPSNTSIFNATPSTVSTPFTGINQNSSSLFSAKPFSSTTTSTTSIFNSPTTTFNQKAPFGTTGFAAPGQTQSTTPGFAMAPTLGGTTTPFGGQTTQPQTTNLFGTTAGTFNAPGNIFAPTSTTNNAPRPFALPTTTPSLFPGSTANTVAKSPFGTTQSFSLPTTSFSFNNTTSSSLFNNQIFSQQNTANKTPFTFNSPLQGSPFNQTPTMNTFNPTGGLFNTTASNMFGTGQTSTLFSNPLQPNQPQVPALSLQQSVSYQLPASELLLNRLQTMPYGDSPLLQNTSTQNQSVKFTSDTKNLYQYKVGQKAASAPKVPRNMNISQLNTSLLFDDLDEDNPDDKKTAVDIFSPRKSIKRLVLKPKDSILNKSSNDSSLSFGGQRSGLHNSKENIEDSSVNEIFSPKTPTTINNKSPIAQNSLCPPSQGFDSFLASGDTSITSSINTIDSNLACEVKLTKQGYYTVPAFNELDKYFDRTNNTCVIPNFTIGRKGYGEIQWSEPVDIKGLNLDEIVQIEEKEVIVYPDDKSQPTVGQGLNKPAQITLHRVWPMDKASRVPIDDPQRLKSMKYAEKIELATIKLGATFKEYKPETGTWIFSVKHFSKYGLEDDETDDEGADKRVLIVEHKKTPEQTSPLKTIMMSSQITQQFDPSFITDKQSYIVEDVSTLMDEYDGSLEKSLEVFPDYYDSMRNAFFPDDEEDSDSFEESLHIKKPKYNLTNDERRPKEMSEIFTNYVPKIAFIKKRDLILEPEPLMAREKVISDISSVQAQGCPKIRFCNGSSNFVVIRGKSVLFYYLDMVPDVGNHFPRFENQLNQNTIIHSEEDKLPFLEVKPIVRNRFNTQLLEELVDAYYGELTETTEYGQHHERINRVIDWLACKNKLEKKPKGVVARIIYYMCCNDLKSAMQEAIQGKYPKLALIICSGNNISVKSSLIKQLESWRKSGADKFIDIELLKIYIILSGGVSWLTSSGKDINVLENLTWTQQLCLMLVFSTHRGIRDCVENLTIETDDVEYYIIAGHSPLRAIDAASNHLEAWFLHQSLQSYNIIVDDVRSDLVHLMMWSQLLSKSVKLACYVASHIKSDILRESAIADSITYFAPKFSPYDDTWLIENLKIPSSFIAKMKAIHFKCQFNYEKQAFSLLEGGEWAKAHDIFLEKIFPELVINENIATLREIIDKFKPYRDYIPNWYSNGANIYDLYSLSLLNQNEANLDEFNIELLKCNNVRQTLCQSEMSRKMNNILVSTRKTLYPVNSPIPPDYALKELNYNCRFLAALLSHHN